MLVDCYVAIWNEADTERRHAAVAELWTEDALDVLQPPQKVLEAAAALDMTAIFQTRGHKELEARVDRAYEEFVARGQFSFRSWATWPASAMSSSSSGRLISADGEVAGVGLEFVVLGVDGRIRLDYQFIEQ